MKKVGLLSIIACFAFLSLSSVSCNRGNGQIALLENSPVETSDYTWEQLTEHAAYPTSYNYPVFVAKNRMWAFQGRGNWDSADGKTWTESRLPSIRRNVYETEYVQFKDAVYALGENQGNYEHMRFSSKIRRTIDFTKWETLAEKSNLPGRIFYGFLAFNDKLWLFGGYDGKDYHNDVWNSADGVNWTRVTQHAAWTPRVNPTVAAFKDRIFVIGGGVIDGTPNSYPNSDKEIWSSANGTDWIKESGNMQNRAGGGKPVLFDGKLWLVGANRDGNFARSCLVSDDAVNWREESAPWSPRGGAAAWVFDGKLYMTGGKYSVTENGEIRFIYSNDVWAMTKAK